MKLHTHQADGQSEGVFSRVAASQQQRVQRRPDHDGHHEAGEDHAEGWIRRHHD